MKTGIIFDIQEGSIYEGDGLRITIFMKGCPLRCKWCHSPEGQKMQVEHLKRKDGSEMTIGKEWTSEQLASYMDRMSEVFNGGFTFTGGDPLMQADFLIEAFDQLKCHHDIVIETAGYGDFDKLVELGRYCSKVHFGIKTLDDDLSSEYVGVSNLKQATIIQNFDKRCSTRYDLVIPQMKGITTTKKFNGQLDSLTKTLKHLDKVEKIPFNELTDAKKCSFYSKI